MGSDRRERRPLVAGIRASGRRLGRCYRRHRMRIALGSDHAGFELKERMRGLLESGGHEVRDVGTGGEASTDYPIADTEERIAEFR